MDDIHVFLVGYDFGAIALKGNFKAERLVWLVDGGIVRGTQIWHEPARTAAGVVSRVPWVGSVLSHGGLPEPSGSLHGSWQFAHASGQRIRLGFMWKTPIVVMVGFHVTVVVVVFFAVIAVVPLSWCPASCVVGGGGVVLSDLA